MKTPSNIRIDVSGNGPPVLFSSGLYGMAPHFAYSDFLNMLRQEFTILRTNRPIKKADVDEIATTIGVDNLGLVTHSSIWKDVLDSDRIHRSVLLDPNVLPRDIGFEGIKATTCALSHPSLVIRSSKTYDDETPFIPTAFKLLIDNAEIISEEDVGHSDILNDFWADATEKIGLHGLRSARKETTSFDRWNATSKTQEKSVIAKRRAYREKIAGHTIDFLKPLSSSLVSLKGDEQV